MDKENHPRDPPPDSASCWVVNDPDGWPDIDTTDIYEYLVQSKAMDKREMKAFRSTFAYNYVQCGWLGVLAHCSAGTNSTFVRATVSPSQPGIGRMDYKAWILADNQGDIRTASCTCPAGAGRACSHVAALMFAVALRENSLGPSCTDLPVAWGHGAKQVSLQRVNTLSFRRPTILAQRHTADSPAERRKHYGYQVLEEMVEAVDRSPVRGLFNIPGSLLHQAVTARLAAAYEPNTVQHGNCMAQECEHCMDFFNKFVGVDESTAEQLCSMTQSQCGKLWLMLRKLRLSSSMVADVPKTSKGDPEKVVTRHLYPRFKGNQDTRRGQVLEPHARLKLAQHLRETITTSGTVVSTAEPWLCASPDGLIGNDTIVEIKSTQSELARLFSGSSYGVRRNAGGKLEVRESSGFHYQMQICMFCTGRAKCYLMIYRSNSEYEVIKVDYKEKFIHAVLPRLKAFYFTHLLPRIVDEYMAGRLEISEGYRQVVLEEN